MRHFLPIKTYVMIRAFCARMLTKDAGPIVLILLASLILSTLGCGKKGFRIEREYPNPYVQFDGVLLSGFVDTSLWTSGGISAHKDRDSLIFHQGRYSLKLTSIDGNVAYAYRSIRPTSFYATRNFSLWLYVHIPPDSSGDLNTKLQCIRLKFTSSPSSWDSFMGVTIDDSSVVSGWNHLVIGKSSFVANGSENWNNKMVRIRVEVAGDGKGDTVAVSFDELRYDYRARAKCVIAFDDIDTSQYTLAYPAMKARDMKGVCFVVSSWVGTQSRMDTTQLRVLYNNGWDISNHTMSHPHGGLPGLTDAQKRREINGCRSWLLNHGFIRGADFFAYPYGKYDSSTVAIVREQHTLARSMVMGFHQPNLDRRESDILYKLKFLYITSGGAGFRRVTPDMVKTDIDEAADQGKLIVLGFHSICNGSGCGRGVQYNYDSLLVILDYLQSRVKDIDVVTFSDYLRGHPTLISRRSELADKIPDLRSFLGACDSCYTVIYRAKGTADIDSILIVDPTTKADSVVSTIIFHPKKK
ncbi:MAG: polysaccharide deacetylase family protein [Candidatus Zixiibacteriota bacterium]